MDSKHDILGSDRPALRQEDCNLGDAAAYADAASEREPKDDKQEWNVTSGQRFD